MSDIGTPDSNPSPALTPQAAAELLAWYAEMGIDLAIDDTPHDQFAESARETSSREIGSGSTPKTTAGAVQPTAKDQQEPAPLSPPRPAAARVAAPRNGMRALPEGYGPSADESKPPARPVVPSVAPEAAIQSARDLAASCTTLDDLKVAMDTFEGCALKQTAQRLCFADGNPQARIMLVGEAPGADEDRAGLPFVGRSGQLLDKMLAAIGMSRANDVYIANTVPWRPPGNRTPSQMETAICQPFIARQIELKAPDLIVCLGGPSTQSLLGIRDGILRARGRWFTYQAGSREIPALATLHPAYLLRQPLQKRQAWQDLKALKTAFDALPPR